MTASKTTIRKHALEKRDLVSAAEAHEAASAMKAAALGLIRRLSGDARPAVALYWPIRSEVNTRPLIEALHAQGVPVLLPAMTAVRQPLHFRAFTPGDELEKGPFGLSEPAPGARGAAGDRLRAARGFRPARRSSGLWRRHL